MAWLEGTHAKIHYETWGDGDGPWLTLVNGFSRPLTDFRSMARFLADKNWRVLTFDNRGAGMTETTGPFTNVDMAEDLIALWDAVGCRQGHLAGISLGGMIVQTAALRFPERIKSLVLISTAAKAVLISPAVSKDVESDLLRYFSPQFLERNQLFVRGVVKETAKVFHDPRSLKAAGLQRNAMQNFDVMADLGKMSLPTLVLHGESDLVIPIAAAEALAQNIPGAKLQVFKGAGHLLLAETPKALYQTVYEFCEAVEQDPVTK